MSQIRSRKQKRFPPPPRSKSDRIFIGGGYRTNSGGGSDADGAGDGGRGGGRNTNVTTPLNPNSSGGVCCDRTPLAASVATPWSSSSCPAITTAASAGFLDLNAVSAAAARSHGSGGRGKSGSGSSAQQPVNDHLRNRFAPMVESEVERFQLQPSVASSTTNDD